MSDVVHVVAEFTVKADKVEDFVREARASLVEPTVGEPGCIRYELCQDVDDATRFAMIEAWESEQALKVHLSQKSLQEAVGRLAPLVAGPPSVRRLRVA